MTDTDEPNDDASVALPDAVDAPETAADPADTPVTVGKPDRGADSPRPPRPDGPAPRSERRRLTHVDRSGRPRMVDVSTKPPTARRAVAEAEIAVSPETLSLVIDGGGAKGDVLTVAELAGVMGGKRTAELIPLCHPIPLTDLVVAITPDRAASALRVRAEAATTAPTGVEMEALTAASIAALTVYDMVKGVERDVEIRSVRLVSKSGGRSGEWTRPESGRSPARRGRKPGDRVAGRIGRRPRG